MRLILSSGLDRSDPTKGPKNASARSRFPGAGLPERSRARLSAKQHGRLGPKVQDLYFQAGHNGVMKLAIDIAERSP